MAHQIPAGTTALRPEIQALRAIAVTAVVVYHLFPSVLSGGYIGVDVFFAISGYLIIGHLVREVESTGRLAIGAFWAQRARRLLPASLLVLVATGAGVLLWVPTIQWQQWFREIAASALYVQNWQLAADAVDYLGAENSPSPVQHFWSLSVEEQLYLVWPLILIGLLIVGRRLPIARRILVTGVVLVALTVASFIWSIIAVAAGDAAAYFVTTTRAWEFGAGGVLAYVVARHPVGRERLRSVVSWMALVVLAVCFVAYTPTTPFPGAAALLPVVSTLAIIWAGTPSARWSPSALMRARPVQWLGGISYSLYLWHWPLIVLLPFALGRPLGVRLLLVTLAITLVLAWLTKALVEDPVRRSPMLLTRPPWVSLVSMLTATALVIGASGVLYTRTADQVGQDAALVEQAVEAPSECVGAPAALGDCELPFAVTAITNPAVAATDIGVGVQVSDECKQSLEDARVISCEVGDVVSPTRTIALVGDSHAGHFLEALDIYGAAHDVRFIAYLKTWCAGTGATGIATENFATPGSVDSCAVWGSQVQADILADPTISAVVFSNFTRAYTQPSDAGLGRTITAADYSAGWRPLLDAGLVVIAMVDIPAASTDVPACVAQNLDEYDPCRFAQEGSGLPDADNPMLVAAGADAVRVVDLRDVFCTEGTCHAVIGGLIVYFGSHHMTASFARTIAEIVGDRIVGALR